MIFALGAAQPLLSQVGNAHLSGAPPQPGQLAAPAGQQADNQEGGLLQLPNTVSAPPLTTGGKFRTGVLQTFGYRGLLGAAVSASIGQASGTPYKWGGGAEGFGKRYASALGGNLTRQSMAFALNAWLHEDPRYFPSESKSFKSRVTNSFKQVFVCKTDSDHASFAYARVVSAFANGQLVNAWQPDSNASFGDGVARSVFTLGGDLAYNLGQEFFTFVRPNSVRNRP